jgi:hypothetical protein
MVQIIYTIPEKQATMILVPKQRPKLEGELISRPMISYGDLVIPSSMSGDFLKRCGIDMRHIFDGMTLEGMAGQIEKANKKKDIYLRYAGDKPLSVVTDRFVEIKPKKILEEVQEILGTKPTVRYFWGDERVHMNFPIKSRLSGFNLVVNTGAYGVYGGSGKEAVSYGLSHFNKVCSNWTLFLRQSLSDYLVDSSGRILHLQSANPREAIEELAEAGEALDDAFEAGRDKRFKYDELDAYFNMYEPKGLNKKMADTIRKENPDGVSAYDLSYRLTQLVQDDKLSDITRGRIEHLAGEVILCYEGIVGKIDEELKRAAILPN